MKRKRERNKQILPYRRAIEMIKLIMIRVSKANIKIQIKIIRKRSKIKIKKKERIIEIINNHKSNKLNRIRE